MSSGIVLDDGGIGGELSRLGRLRFDAVVEKSMTQIYNRGKQNSKASGLGTPVGDYPPGSGRVGGQLRQSLGQSGDVVGYAKSYAPHVEYGHRTRGGGYVQGQRFLHDNVEEQRPIFREDLKKHLRGK